MYLCRGSKKKWSDFSFFFFPSTWKHNRGSSNVSGSSFFTLSSRGEKLDTNEPWASCVARRCYFNFTLTLGQHSMPAAIQITYECWSRLNNSKSKIRLLITFLLIPWFCSCNVDWAISEIFKLNCSWRIKFLSLVMNSQRYFKGWLSIKVFLFQNA